MPNPKRRHSKARRDKRRAHDALTPPASSLCATCGERKLPLELERLHLGDGVADVGAGGVVDVQART